MPDPIYTIRLIEPGLSAAWVGVIGVIVGAGSGFLGQWFMARNNYKREVRKTDFQIRYKVYNELIKKIKASWKEIEYEYYMKAEFYDEAEPTSKDPTVIITSMEGASVKIERHRADCIIEITEEHLIIISDAVQAEIQNIYTKFCNMTYCNSDLKRLIKQMQKDIDININ